MTATRVSHNDVSDVSWRMSRIFFNLFKRIAAKVPQSGFGDEHLIYHTIAINSCKYHFARILSVPEDVMSTQIIGARIKALREERGLSQDALADMFGFKDRQTVSAIETGERRVSAEELIVAVEKLGARLEYFTDPFLLVGEGRFSWRQTDVGPQRLGAYERMAGRWIAAFRVIAPQVGVERPLLRPALPLHKRSTFEEAMEAGERFAAEFELGPVPAASLRGVMERALHILVLDVDALAGISGAACRLPELDAVLINRVEPLGRRHFDLAHELLHLLTWDAMPPEHSEAATEAGGNRVEQLANNFASALLMPTTVLDQFGDTAGLETPALVAWLNDTAHALQVTASALKWRLVAMKRLSALAARAIPDAALRNNGREPAEAAPPPLFSGPFMATLAKALDEGRISVRRAAGLLDLTVEDLADTFAAQGVQPPFEP